MPLINFLSVQTFLSSVGAVPLNYIPISAIPVDQGDAPFAEAAKLYASVDAMLEDGWLTTDAAVLAASQVFGQTLFTATPPTRVSIVHRATPDAQVSEFTVGTTTDGAYRLFIAEIGGTAVEAALFNAVGQTATQIKDGLITAFNLGPFAATHTAASVDADSGSITADVAGVPFVLTATGPAPNSFTIDITTPNAGLYEDLDAAWAAVKFWGVIPDPAEADGTKGEASRWAQASAALNSIRRNVCFLQSNDGDIITATEPNFASNFVLLNRDRTFPLYHANQTDKMSAAWFGRYGGQDPGSRMWHGGQLGGTTLTDAIVYSLTQGDNLKDQRVSWVERDGPATTDALRVFWGQGSGARFVVQKQAEDYWWLRVNQGLAQVLESQAGANLDADGIQRYVAKINEVNGELGTSDPPVLDLARTTVTPVDLATLPAAQIELGDYKSNGAGIQVDTVLIPKLRSIGVTGIFALA